MSRTEIGVCADRSTFAVRIDLKFAKDGKKIGAAILNIVRSFEGFLGFVSGLQITKEHRDKSTLETIAAEISEHARREGCERVVYNADIDVGFIPIGADPDTSWSVAREEPFLVPS